MEYRPYIWSGEDQNRHVIDYYRLLEQSDIDIWQKVVDIMNEDIDFNVERQLNEPKPTSGLTPPPSVKLLY